MRGIILISIFSSILAQAENALISRVTRYDVGGLSGNRVEICQIFPTYIYISHGYGDNFLGHTLSERRPIFVSESVKSLIAFAASSDPIESSPNPVCGGQTVEIYASNTASLDTLLLSTGGCGYPLQKRTGENSKILFDMISDNCPKH
jgi:hypothetical protein